MSETCRGHLWDKIIVKLFASSWYIFLTHIWILCNWKCKWHRECNWRTEMRIRMGLTDTLHCCFYRPRLYKTIAVLFRSWHSHCNVSDKGFWTCSSSWVMQYTLARWIPTHPTFPAFLKYLPNVEIRKLDCLAGWTSQVAKIMLATQTKSHQVECITCQLVP